jgi:hypothetical protein
LGLLVPGIAVVAAVITFAAVKANQHPRLDPSGAPITSNTGGGNVPAGNPCYMTLSGAYETEYVTVLMAPGQDCGTITLAMQQVFLGATVTNDGSSKPWPPGYSAVCDGLVTAAKDVSTVVAQNGVDSGGACNALGFSPVP